MLSFYQFKIDWYNYKKFYVIHIVTTKKIPIKYVQEKISMSLEKKINETQRRAVRAEMKDKINTR